MKFLPNTSATNRLLTVQEAEFLKVLSKFITPSHSNYNKIERIRNRLRQKGKYKRKIPSYSHCYVCINETTYTRCDSNLEAH